MEPQAITEEMGVHKEWYQQAEKVTPETIGEFVRHLTEDYNHDYGTIVHACSAAAIAGAHAVNHSPTGGITGFQAGCIMWEFISKWMHEEGKPLQLVHYENMLFPQYSDRFAKTITKKTWEYLQTEAKKNLANVGHATDGVVLHWQNIVNGKVPFGYAVVED